MVVCDIFMCEEDIVFENADMFVSVVERLDALENADKLSDVLCLFEERIDALKDRVAFLELFIMSLNKAFID